MSWSSTHVLFWIIWGTFCAGSHPNVHFRCAADRVQTLVGPILTTSANALTTSTPQLRIRKMHFSFLFFEHQYLTYYNTVSQIFFVDLIFIL